MQQLKEPEPVLPHCDDEFLVLLFYEAGMYELNGGNVCSLSWTTLKDWKELLERDDIGHYEIKLLKRMSECYVNEYHAASADKFRIPPDYVVPEEIPQEEVNERAKSLKENLLAVAAAMKNDRMKT